MSEKIERWTLQGEGERMYAYSSFYGPVQPNTCVRVHNALAERCEKAEKEVERLRDMIGSGTAAGYEESMAAKDAEIARLREWERAMFKAFPLDPKWTWGAKPDQVADCIINERASLRAQVEALKKAREAWKTYAEALEDDECGVNELAAASRADAAALEAGVDL